MGDSSWMRLLPGQRCRTPLSSSHPSPHDHPPHHHHHHQTPPQASEDGLEPISNPHHLRISPRPLAGFYHSASDPANDILVREADRLQNAPSVDEMADILRTTIMVAPTPPTLGPQHTSHVLHVIEGYSKLRAQLAKAERDVARLEDARREDRERSKAQVAEWAAQEARYRAEIKRLELIIQKVSGRGVEAVALARSGSLVRRGAATAAERGHLAVDENEFERDELGTVSPCVQVEDGQARRTSSFCDTFDTTARLTTTRQLWRPRSENNLLDPSSSSRKGLSPARRQGPVLIHLASSQKPTNLEPDVDGGLADEKLWPETDVDQL